MFVLSDSTVGPGNSMMPWVLTHACVPVYVVPYKERVFVPRSTGIARL